MLVFVGRGELMSISYTNYVEYGVSGGDTFLYETCTVFHTHGAYVV